MITEYISIRYIDVSGKSSSGRIAVGRFLYAYIINHESFNEMLMNFIDESVLASIQKNYPTALLKKENLFMSEQVYKWEQMLRSLPCMTINLLPYIPDEEISQCSQYGIKFTDMPAIPISLYMTKVGCEDDIFSPFNRIELRYTLHLTEEDKKKAKALMEFSRKWIKTPVNDHFSVR